MISENPMSVTFSNRAAKPPLSILADSDGLVKAGQLIAIIGRSGSGETTLPNTLTH